ncbi:MAG TPA: transcriptional regulator [Candidatus Rifleibacterium sp.]|nr:transcriptional regulator [Candidatus Rifleibacterium sp.]HPT45577.1 transcriptional regulator [Candidatus Rifleibacterium sp.]
MSSIAKPVVFGGDLQSAWSKLAGELPLARIHSRQQYNLAVKVMEHLADLVNDDTHHPLTGLLEIFEVLVEDYDRAHHQISSVSGVELLRNLMLEQGLKQSDLTEIGSQGVVSEILSGKRRLNKRHAVLLARRFSLPEGLFTRL